MFLRICDKGDILGGVKNETSDVPKPSAKKRERVRRKCEVVETVWMISGRVCDRDRDVVLAQEEGGRARKSVEEKVAQQMRQVRTVVLAGFSNRRTQDVETAFQNRITDVRSTESDTKDPNNDVYRPVVKGVVSI